MSENRPAVPLPLQRRLKEEAGYRCAIPTCGQTVGLQLAHIEPWSKVKEHKFENMICLCSTCHTRYDNVGDIPKLSILHFKRNLSLLSHRYTQVENQLLGHYARDLTQAESSVYAVHPGMILLYSNLIDDGLIAVHRQPGMVIAMQGIEPNVFIVLTPAGMEFVRAIAAAESLE